MYKYKDVSIRIEEGDITLVETDAIVNAAKNSLLGGGGVDGAIHRAGGPRILDQCKKIGGCPTGEARITVAGDLPAKYVIHTVGPVYRGGTRGEDQLLYNAYYNSLLLGKEYELKTIAFPAISTGVYGYPIERAVETVLMALKDFIDGEGNYREIRFILFSKKDYDLYKEYFDENL